MHWRPPVILLSVLYSFSRSGPGHLVIFLMEKEPVLFVKSEGHWGKQVVPFWEIYDRHILQSLAVSPQQPPSPHS